MLEVGGGVGAFQVELLRAGASWATSVEVTDTHEAAAAQLLAEMGLSDRVERRVHDFARAAGEVPEADIVVLNRVVCCYPDMPLLVGAAAGHTRGLLALSFPNSRWTTRLGLAAGNLILRVTRVQFHVFAHSPARILEIAAAQGLVTVEDRRGLFWEVAVLERAA